MLNPYRLEERRDKSGATPDAIENGVPICFARFRPVASAKIEHRRFRAHVAKELFVSSFGYRFLESQRWQGSRGDDICRYANFFPAFCIGSTRCLGLAGVLNSITAQQQMCRQTIAGGQTKDHLRDFGRIAVLSAP